jgi:benzoyl-CoA reductase/2-hydroxyglutaryl-CoA dehydratase subunit BcrC/BadD/HgdB
MKKNISIAARISEDNKHYNFVKTELEDKDKSKTQLINEALSALKKQNGIVDEPQQIKPKTIKQIVINTLKEFDLVHKQSGKKITEKELTDNVGNSFEEDPTAEYLLSDEFKTNN